MEKKVMSKQELLEKREDLLNIYHGVQRKSARKPLLTKKERKVLGIGKDEGRASVRNVRVAPRKVSIVSDLIRGKGLDEALAILTYTPKAASPIFLKLLKSAESNAVNNNDLTRDHLYVAEVQVGQGPTLKRFRARGKGFASRINKRTSNIAVVLKEKA